MLDALGGGALRELSGELGERVPAGKRVVHLGQTERAGEPLRHLRRIRLLGGRPADALGHRQLAWPKAVPRGTPVTSATRRPQSPSPPLAPGASSRQVPPLIPYCLARRV